MATSASSPPTTVSNLRDTIPASIMRAATWSIQDLEFSETSADGCSPPNLGTEGPVTECDDPDLVNGDNVSACMPRLIGSGAQQFQDVSRLPDGLSGILLTVFVGHLQLRVRMSPEIWSFKGHPREKRRWKRCSIPGG